MNDIFRGLMFGIAALVAGFIAIFIALAMASAILSSQDSGHSVISLHFMSPIGVAVLAFLLLTFAGGFSYGARRHGVQTH
jgi:hypothetical protein